MDIEKYVVVTLQVIVFVLACIGNTIVIIVTCKYLRFSVLTHRFIVNLAIADMFTGVTALSQVVYVLVPEIENNVYVCLLRYQVVLCMTLTSQLTVAFTILDRYLAICFPHRYASIMNGRRANVLITISWAYPVVLGVLPFCGLNSWESSKRCTFQEVTSPWQLLTMTLTLWSFTIIIVFMYALIIRRACLLYRQIKPLPSTPPKISLVLPEVARSSTEHCQRQVSVQSSSADRREKTLHTLRGAKSLAAITFMFSVCWLPHTYFQFRTYLDPAYVHSTEWGAANWLVFLGMSNSIMNPFIYAWQRRDFNTACRRLFARGVQIE